MAREKITSVKVVFKSMSGYNDFNFRTKKLRKALKDKGLALKGIISAQSVTRRGLYPKTVRFSVYASKRRRK